VSLDEFRDMWVYRHAVEVKLIVNDEWASTDVTLSPFLVERLWTLLPTLTGERLQADDGTWITIGEVRPTGDDAAVLALVGGSRGMVTITKDEIEEAAAFWLGGASVAPEALEAGFSITGRPYVNILYISAIFERIVPQLGEIVLQNLELHRYPVYDYLIRERQGGIPEPLHPEDEAEPRWLDKDESPFGLPVLDCRSFTLTTLASTADPEVAERFNRLRSSSGAEHRDKIPNGSLWVRCQLHYPFEFALPEMSPPEEGPVFVAHAMEDKWDIYHYDGKLYFCRSWSGELTFLAVIAFNGREAIVSQIAAASARVDGDKQLAVRQVDFLIKRLLFGVELPHPLPATLPPDPESIVHYSFIMYGRGASFAAYGDTTSVVISRMS
jgi:hypothetical protein